MAYENQNRYQDSAFVSQLTQDILKNMAPVQRQQENRINQQYDASRRGLNESLAARGGYRGGSGVNQLMGLEQNRNQQLADSRAGMVQSAMAQAVPYAQLGMQEAGLTGQYGGQQTLAAQQLANQIAQQALANKYTEAGLTGRFQDASGAWHDTLAGQQLGWQQDSARDFLATQLWSAYLENTQNAAVPQTAVDWINQMFSKK